MLKVGGDDMPRPVVRGVKLGDDADAYLLEALELRTSQNEERGRAILGKLRALAPQPARAAARLRLALARAEARFGDPQAAVAMLDAQADAGPEAAETHYLLGRAWMRQAESLSGDEQAAARERARSHFFKAYRLKKDDAPTLYHLALALSRNGVDANALNAARAARGLAPSVPEYAVLEAQFDLQAGDAERAVRALGPLASDPHHPEQAARMRQAIAAIKDGKSLRDVASLMSEPPKKPTP
jgi:tetratricopeptide (TPR) repeat protein